MEKQKPWHRDGDTVFWIMIFSCLGKAWPDTRGVCLVVIVAVAMLALFRTIDYYVLKKHRDSELYLPGQAPGERPKNFRD